MRSKLMRNVCDLEWRGGTYSTSYIHVYIYYKTKTKNKGNRNILKGKKEKCENRIKKKIKSKNGHNPSVEKHN